MESIYESIEDLGDKIRCSGVGGGRSLPLAGVAPAGRTIVLVDPKGTSQICSNCQEIVEKDLSVRVHVCPYCNYEEDRDVNAARNILARALSILQGQRDRPAILSDT